ncbi:putative flagellin [Selenomonas ruminantium subsp. lactilytica TAM6421]|uniref:Flagellin n=1 Tax=Selenomonas ruminantium subsp. lactilytica (strain NBRC 103574 / TAM6421) TaxID=927704 RepID=I0GQX7_SELRL|nr:flagellin [Selenomonas ruminantium]BAL83164.1 putative flagellin [Selenomonas ruminantium subsp. lactilytica TAM6421]
MAMTVKNNPTATLVLGELNKNVSKLGKQLSKVANGQKIVSVGDGTADYSISERMQAQIRSLRQDIDNTKTGRSMLQVAEGGIQGIVDELREMKQLAINAANDSNTDADRATIQKEFDEKLKQIDDIVATTNYNGKLLLNGEYGRWHTAMVTDNPNGSSNIVSTGVIEPSGTPITLASGNHTITTAGVYVLGTGFTGDITIADGLSGVKITQSNSAQLTDVHIIGPTSGNANLWIEGLNIKNTTDQSCIRFSGSDNVLSIKGNNNIDYSSYMASGSVSNEKATINVGGGLTIEGTGTLEMISTHTYSAMIGTDNNEISNADLTINSGTYVLTGTDSRQNVLNSARAGAVIGSGICGSIGDITINGGTFDIFTSGDAAAIGSSMGVSYMINSGLAGGGDITIRNANITAVADGGACIGSGVDNTIGNITIEDSIIHAENKALNHTVLANGIPWLQYLIGSGAGIGSGSYRYYSDGANAGDIVIRNSEIFSSSNRGAGVGSGYKSYAKNITIENVTGQITSIKGEDIGKGLEGGVGTINISGYPEPTLHETSISGTPLKIHTGTKANQRINCYIENLGTKALFNVKTDEELENLANVRTRASAQRLLGSLTDPSVEGPLDKAINYALNEMTQVGSYINRLEQTENTLTVNHENTTSSESTIRDADMAKEMTEYTKSNVLAQAAQSMLAQANQNSSSVLSLLQ